MWVALALGAGCDPGTIEAVGGPGGVYRPDQGCTLVEGAPSCPAAPSAGLLRFESTLDAARVNTDDRETLTDFRVTCVRSYCGTGSLVARAELVWMDDDRQYPQRMGVFAYDLNPPVDLMGKTVEFSVYVEGPSIPMHAQVGVIYDFWRWVAWTPVSAGWNHVEGVVSPDNPLTEIDPSVTSIPVTSIRVEIYVPVQTSAGPDGTWSGNVYLDEVGWR
jgi:hypothetical protein